MCCLCAIVFCFCSATFNFHEVEGKGTHQRDTKASGKMGDRGGPDGDVDRGPGLDTTLQDSDIESNWDQVLCYYFLLL